MGWQKPLSPDERTYLMLAATAFGTVGVGTAWYFFTGLFYESSPPQHCERVETFFQNLRTPVDKHGVEAVQTSIYRLMGGLCMVYGIFILLLMVIPNRFNGRLCFLFCGGIIFAVGMILLLRARARQRRSAVPPGTDSDLKT